MTLNQEDALYEFLELSNSAFEIDDIISHVKNADPHKYLRLAEEIEGLINFRKLAFKAGATSYISRHAFFLPIPFVISPTRLELINGILIPGHRCVPFANGNLLPQDYSFYWNGEQIPFTSSEGSPDEFYPYYNIFGEEYAPQYVARDNSENEAAFFSDPYEDPAEVSIKTLEMRQIYMESSFIPGDRFLARTLDWKSGKFLLEKISRDEWKPNELNDWLKAAEEGMDKSFSLLGAGTCTEEQLAYAYWHGSKRMREVPAYSLEEYLYEKSDLVEIAPYGIETRFWYAGREIPDLKELDNENKRPDSTSMEFILHGINIPISEFTVQAYIRDSLFREDGDCELIISRIIPANISLEEHEWKFIFEYTGYILEDFRKTYNRFSDKHKGPIRTRAADLHSAVIDLALRLKNSDIDSSWLPRHTFIILSQIQMHSAGALEDLGSPDSSSPDELDALDGSLDSMVETYEDIKELIDESMNNYRRNSFSILQPDEETGIEYEKMIQISIGGIDVWRRLLIPENYTLENLHNIIQAVFEWKASQSYSFSINDSGQPAEEDDFTGLHIVKSDSAANTGMESSISLKDLATANKTGFFYKYGDHWNIRIMILSGQEGRTNKPARCVAGAGSAPPEFIGGPVKYKRILSALEKGNDLERSGARQELGRDFIPGDFDMEACNSRIKRISINRMI